MKIAAILLSLLFSSNALAKLTSVKDSKALLGIFEEISTTVEASGEFIVTEDFFVEDLKKCKKVSYKRVLKKFEESANLLDSPYPKFRKAKSDFLEIIGKKQYLKCVEKGSVPYYDYEKISFITTDYAYRVQFELAWEN